MLWDCEQYLTVLAGDVSHSRARFTRGASAPKQTSAKTMWIGSLGPRMFWGTRATKFSIYTTKMEGAEPKILGTWAKFKQVPCQTKLLCKPGLGQSVYVSVHLSLFC